MRFLICLLLFLTTTAFNKKAFKTNWDHVQNIQERSFFKPETVSEESEGFKQYSCLEIPECITECIETSDSDEEFKACLEACCPDQPCFSKCMKNEKCRDNFAMLPSKIRLNKIKKEMWNSLLEATKFNLIRNYYNYGVGVTSNFFITHTKHGTYDHFTVRRDFIKKALIDRSDKDSYVVLLKPLIYAEERLNCDIVYPNPLQCGFPDFMCLEGLWNILGNMLGSGNKVVCSYTNLDQTFQSDTRHCDGNICKKKELPYTGWFSREKHNEYIRKLYEEENAYQALIHPGMVSYVHKVLSDHIYNEIIDGKRPAFEHVLNFGLPAHTLPDFLLAEIEQYNANIEQAYMKFRYFVDKKTFYKLRKEVFEGLKKEAEGS